MLPHFFFLNQLVILFNNFNYHFYFKTSCTKPFLRYWPYMLNPVNGSRVLYGHILDWFLVVGFLHNSFLLDFGMRYRP